MHYDLDWETFMRFQKDGECPKVTVAIFPLFGIN